MKKTLLLLALFAGSLLSANADDHLTALVKPGNAVIGVQLKNATDYTAFEMEITLPEGMTVPTQTVNGKVDVAANAVTIASNRQSETAPHKAFAHLNGNKLKVVAFSASSYESGTPTNPIVITDGNKDFREQKGDLILITVNTTNSCIASDLAISNAKFVKKVGTEFLEDILVTTTTGKLGDTNNDNDVNLTDAQNMLSFFVGETVESFNEEAADTDYDGNVNLTDAQNALSIFVGNY